MKDFLKTYKIELTTLSPVYVGSGFTIGKKEYIFDKSNNMVYIPNLQKMYGYLRKKGKARAYEDYMLKENKDLFYWLRNNGIGKSEYKEWIDYKYKVPNEGDVFKNDKKKQIYMCSKDAFGMPYIPGSSLKGAIRTALIAYEIKKNNDSFRWIANKVEKAKLFKRKNCLRDESKAVEIQALNKLERKADKNNNYKDIVNDRMTGIKISDSYSLEVADIVLCQKVDVTLADKCITLPFLRESIKPGTKIIFDLTIDTSLAKYKVDDILKAINMFFDEYKVNFLNSFTGNYGLKEKRSANNIIYVGGGSGFVTKTVIYQLLGKKKGLEIVSKYLSICFENGHNDNDMEHGVSPHILKCTKYNNNLYEFGMCSMNIIKS